MVLFLGAGVNNNCQNGRNNPIKLASELEGLVRKAIGAEETDINLGDLIEDYRQRLGDRAFAKLLMDEFSDCTPSQDLKDLFSYSWFRIYTLNIDDAVENIPRSARQQRFLSKNRDDLVDERRDYDSLEIVHLNGFIKTPDHGYIFTPEQYRKEISKSSRWYKKCAEDFYDRIFIFLGTKLDEPVFLALIEEIARDKGEYSSRSFLITPTLPSERRQRNLKKQNIDAVEGTLASFIEFLRREVGANLTPTQIATSTADIDHRGASTALITSITKLATQEWLAAHRLAEGGRRRAARDFFNGFPPSWEVVVNQLSVPLAHDSHVLAELKRFLQSDHRLFTLVGQSGSGKTTCLMKATLALAVQDKIPTYVLDERTRMALSDVAAHVDRIESGPAILYVDSLYLFADELKRLDRSLERLQVKVVGQCRLSEWSGRIERVAPPNIDVCELPALQSADYERLCDGLIQHAIAPAFRTLSDRGKQITFLKQSRHQLLMLMKEATQQRRFEEIIEDEFQSVLDPGAASAFCIVGLATLAKNQITFGELRTILHEISGAYDAAGALRILNGIVVEGHQGLMGRHEIYVRHVVDHMIDAQLLKDCFVGFLKYFTRFGQPVITKLGRQRGNLFKFLLNHDLLREIFRKKRNLIMAERVYSSVELEYQLDGHYWLQRGLFYRNDRKHQVARDCLEKSIAAYPGNLFARHALAQQKLILAALAGKPSNTLRREVDAAVEELESQQLQRAESDEYPLVTLARFHPEVLLKWGDRKGAQAVAREYFERLEALHRSLPKVDRNVEIARKECLRLASTGQWKAPVYH